MHRVSKTPSSPRTPCTPKKSNCLTNQCGGESFSAIKRNQGNYHKYALKLLKGRPLDIVGELEFGHGRVELRDFCIAPVDTENSPFPHIAQIISCTRIYRSLKEGAEPEIATRLFGTSIEYGEKTPQQIARITRGHWSVENLNHWKRDASYWREDSSPKRNPQGAMNLGLLRNALLSIIPFEKFSSLNAAFDYYRDHRGESLNLIETAQPYPE